MRSAIHYLCAYGAIAQITILVITGLAAPRPSLTHDDRMEFIVRNGAIGLIAASLCIATRDYENETS